MTRPPLNSTLLLGAGCFTACTTLATGRSPWLDALTLAVGLVMVAASGYIAGVHVLALDASRMLDGLPQSVTFHEDDDGAKHALVSLVGGDVRTIPIPEDYAGTPRQALAYVVGVLIQEAEA